METQYNCKFFKLLEKQPDSAQMRAIATTKNAVIAAGAGSGKTEVLAKRFSWLVLTGQAKADQILTLTFTNKAANEMYQRIYDTLNFFANGEIGENFSEKEKKLAQQGVKDFADAHVQTLDSYCANIVRQCANRYGITPDFSLASSDGLRDVKEAALKFVFENRDALGIKTFVEAGKFQTFAEKTLAYSINEFTDLTTPPNFFSSKIPTQIDFLVNALNFYFDESPVCEENFPGKYNFQTLIDDFYSELNANFDEKKHENYAKQANELFDFYATNFKGIRFAKELIFSQERDFLRNLQENFEIFKEKLFQLSSASGKCAKANSKISIMKKELLPVLDSIFAYFNQFESVKSLYGLLDAFLEKINFSKRISGNLSFNDVSSLALKILVENPDIREQEIQSYKKIMIDEFQDNNGKNRDLLYLLSINENFEISPERDVYSQIVQKDEFGNILKDNRESEKLFFVGDEKQSIYKFRGADVSIFNELTKNGENLLVPMTYNYRSAPQTVRAFNRIFKNGFGIFKDDSVAQDYEAYYLKDAEKNGVELPELDAQNVPIHFKFIDANSIKIANEESKTPLEKFIPADEQIAYNVAKKICEIKSQNKDASFSDFAILDKNRNKRAEIAKYLSYFNVPYEVDQFNNIFEDGIVNDFYNFLRICVYPSDINAFAAYLCSPLAGLQENSVEIILSYLVDNSDCDFVFDPFANFDDEIQKDLSEREFEKFIKAKNFYAQTKSLVLRQKITKTLDLLWNEKGFKYETLLNSQTELCAEHFDMIFELARRCEENQKSVSWFIDELDVLRNEFSDQEADIDAKDVSYPLERNEAVKIMTIHKSKGLQFKHVFLCGCTAFSFKSEKAQIFFNQKSGLSVRPETGAKNFFVLLDEALSKKKELAEFRRLIYVGITRAIEDVYVTGKWNPQSAEENESKIFENLVKNNYPDFDEQTLNYKEGLPFDFEDLKPLTYRDVKFANRKQNSDLQRNNLIKNAISAYENSKIIKYECNPVEKLEPSKIDAFKKIKENQNENRDENKNAQISFKNDFENREQTEDELFFQLGAQNEEENYVLNSNFTPADFGILAHAYLEAFTNGIAPQNFEPAVSYFKNLNEKEILEKKRECIKFTQDFEKSQIGKSLKIAQSKNLFVRSEWKTKMFYKGAIFTGVFDLIFQNEDGSYTIVDYKCYKNLNPEDFYGQLNCYRTTAAKIFDIPESKIDCKIWDIRNGVIFQVPICRL